MFSGTVLFCFVHLHMEAWCVHYNWLRNCISQHKEKRSIEEMEGLDELVPPRADSFVAVALSGSRKGKYVVNWALEKFVPEGHVYFKFLHVRPVISRIPTPMGNLVPISQVRDDVAAAFRKEVEWQATEKLLPYKTICTKRQVKVEIVQIESNDLEMSIASEINKSNINKLVIGTSSRSIFSRGRSLSSKISQHCPTFCTVYAVSKGKLSSVRSSSSETNSSIRDETNSETNSSTVDEINSVTSFSNDNSSSGQTLSSRTEWTDQGLEGLFSNFRSTSLPTQRIQALSSINCNLLHKRMLSSAATMPLISESSVASNLSWNQQTDTSSENQAEINFEVEKLRIELRHTRGMYAMAQGEALDASRKLNELQNQRLEEENKLKQISLKEQEAEELARQEKARYEAAKKEADYVNYCAEREIADKKDAELRASHDAREKESLENAMTGSFHQYRKFTWEEIMSATSSFSENLKIGMGAYGTVYKCSFHHTTAAVKILHAKEASRTNQFQQELEILKQIRHPHLLILLGACPERDCLVYEFMENGSLEDILLGKNNTSPLLWFDRYRIAWEVASALLFLHNSKPKSIIHRDLKPANILLDRNYVSKIGDVGLSIAINKDSLSVSCKDKGPVGTLCYIDPEYQRTGVVSSQSDVYAFGMVVLQMLTGKPAIGLAHVVETAIENDYFMEVLDPKAGSWPVEETKDLASMVLRCTELRRRDRPDLRDEVLPVLEKIKEFAEKKRNSMLICAPPPPPPPPNHLTCPILKEVMSDPCVAADGYTYDRKGIEVWFQEKDTSPMTNLPLPHKFLIPNYTLLSAIMDWKSENQ